MAVSFLPSMASRDWPPQACRRLDRMDRVEHGWIGIDAGKDHHAVPIDRDRQRLLSRRVINDQPDLVALIDTIQDRVVGTMSEAAAPGWARGWPVGCRPRRRPQAGMRRGLRAASATPRQLSGTQLVNRCRGLKAADQDQRVAVGEVHDSLQGREDAGEETASRLMVRMRSAVTSAR
jgi:hypothetical protein